MIGEVTTVSTGMRCSSPWKERLHSPYEKGRRAEKGGAVEIYEV